MKQHALVDAYNGCKEDSDRIMGNILSFLQRADLELRSNRRLTEIVVNATKEELMRKITDPEFAAMISGFGIAVFEHGGKTYIRLKYK